MALSKFRTTKMRFSGSELAGLTIVLVMMILSWFFVHGQTRGMYDQFAVLGDPLPAMGPVGEAGRNQLGHWGYFWSERAFHYRTTLMFAVDDFTSPEVLDKDIAQQFPDGVDSWREYTLLMEPVYGQLYRWFGHQGEILVEFLTRLIPLIHVLLFLPLYLLARALGARPLLSALAVVLFATCTMGFARFSGSLLLKEDFALLWLMIFLASHFLADRRQSVPLLAAASLSLILLLASWHLSQFLVLVILGSIALTKILDGNLDEKPGGIWTTTLPATYCVACVLAGLTPSLLARNFFFSPTMVMAVSWLLVAVLRTRISALGRSSSRRVGAFIGLFLTLGAASLLNSHFTGDYNHIFGLLTEKLAHGFTRPADPQLLPFEVRVFWAAPFTSVSWADAWSKLGYHLFLLVPALLVGIYFLIKGRLNCRQQAIILMSTAFFLTWLLIERLGVVFLPFGVIAFAVVAEILAARWEVVKNHPRGTSLQVTLAAVLLMILTPAANLVGNMNDRVKFAVDFSRGRPGEVVASDQAYWGFRGDLLRWLVSNTPGPFSRMGSGQAQAVLGDVGVSPQVLLYAGRPVVLNSQFENQPIRQRYQSYLEALFSTDPGQLEEFLRDYQTGYLFIDRHLATNDAPGSAAYMAGLSGPLELDQNIVRLHFSPEELAFLQPVYNNEFYRIFKVGQHPGLARTTWDRNHGNWWNLKHYQTADGQLTDLNGDRRKLQGFEDSLVALQDEQGRLMQILSAITPSGQPSLPELHQRYMELKLEKLGGGQKVADPDQEKQMERLINTIQGYLSTRDPDTGGAMGQALAALFTQGIPEKSPGWRELLETGLAEPSHLAAAGQLLAMLGQYPQAADLLLMASNFFPMGETVAGDGRPGLPASTLALRVRQTTVWYLLAANRVAEARDLAGACARFTSPGSGPAKFFRQVAAIPTD